MNKNIILTASICLTLFLTSCKSDKPQPKNVASEFLGAYLSADFNKAASYCTPKLSEELKLAVKEIENLNESLKKQITTSTAEFVPQIGEIEKIGKGDTLIVNYRIVKSSPDSTLDANVADVIKSSISLVKDEIVGWKVLKLNK
ncbi:MAG: hypothetical protein RSC28_06165 [Bacteroidales bacterium]